jgi:HSP20 family protein
MLDGDTLVIRGELNGAADNAHYVLRERFHGKFERRLTINVPVDISAAQASIDNGVLTLTLPKAEEARPHRITVTTAE